MARVPKKPKRYYRCARCRSLTPATYKTCGTCGYNPDFADAFIRRALVMFPGSREVR